MTSLGTTAKSLKLAFAAGAVGISLAGCAGSADRMARSDQAVYLGSRQTAALAGAQTLPSASALGGPGSRRDRTLIPASYELPQGDSQATATTAAPKPTTAVATVPASAISMQYPAFTMNVEDAQPPIGWTAFCAQHGPECTTKPSTAPRVVAMTDGVWEQMVDANSSVNKAVREMTDMRHWGRVNVWTYPTDGYGDCKDFALEKQRVLLEEGFPREALLLTVVWTRANEGHAVLIVRTDKGDYVLDNLAREVLPWTQAKLDFVKRQSQTDPNAWVYIDGYSRGGSTQVAAAMAR